MRRSESPGGLHDVDNNETGCAFAVCHLTACTWRIHLSCDGARNLHARTNGGYGAVVIGDGAGQLARGHLDGDMQDGTRHD